MHEAVHCRIPNIYVVHYRAPEIELDYQSISFYDIAIVLKNDGIFFYIA